MNTNVNLDFFFSYVGFHKSHPLLQHGTGVFSSEPVGPATIMGLMLDQEQSPEEYHMAVSHGDLLLELDIVPSCP